MDEACGDAIPTEATADRMRRGFTSLGLALADAELASSAARGLAGRWFAADWAAGRCAARGLAAVGFTSGRNIRPSVRGEVAPP